MRLVKNPKTGKYENVYIEPLSNLIILYMRSFCVKQKKVTECVPMSERYEKAKNGRLICLNANALNVESLRRNSLNRRETGWPVERGGRSRYSSIDWC